MMSYYVLKKRYEKEQEKRKEVETTLNREIRELKKQVKKLERDKKLLKELNNMKNKMLRGE